MTLWLATLATLALLAMPSPTPAAAPLAPVDAGTKALPIDRYDMRPQPTLVRDRAALQRLRNNSGITLQWIGWDRRGTLRTTMRQRTLWLNGGQSAADGSGGRVSVDGWVREVDARRFVLVGRVEITDTPDIGRSCLREGPLEFRITQNRRYWRLQQMEVCNGLTDYVDVYF